MKLRHWSLLLWLVLLIGVFSTGIFTGGGLAGLFSSPQAKPTPSHPDPGPQPYPDAYKVQPGKLRNIAVPGGNHGDIPYPCGSITASPPFTGVSPLSIACIPGTPDWGYGDLAVWQANGHSYVAQSGFEYRMYYIWNVDDPYNPILLYNKPFPGGGSASTAIFHFHQFGHEYMATTMRGSGTGCGYFIDNIDDPASPAPIITNKHGTDWCTPHETFVSTDANGDADYAWLTMSSESGSGIKIVALTLPDLSQSNALTETGRYQRPDSAGFAHDSNVVGNRVYIAHWDGGVIVEDKETLAHNTNPTPLNPINSIRPSSFWVHHMVPTTDNKFLFAEDEFLNGSGVQKIKYYDIQNIANPIFLGGITGGDPNSEMSQAHNQIIKNLGPHHDLLLSAFYLAGYRLYDIDSSGSSPVVTQVGGHQLRASGGPNFGGVWGVDSLPCTVRGVQTTCIYSSDMTYGLVVDALGVNPAFDPYPPDPAVITSPIEGQQIDVCSFTITGTAPQDYWSGLARIEVSFDNGATWNTATGTTNWSYQWDISGSGPYTIKVRAVDNAGNVQSIPTQVNVNVTATCGAATATLTPIPPTSTSTSTPNPSCQNYSVATATGTIVPGTILVPGSHCDDCVALVTLPFAVQLYDQTFTSANATSNGPLQFNSAITGLVGTSCMPVDAFSYTIFPLYDDLCTGPCGTSTCSGCGIYTSTTGTAPNRIFNIEWRAVYFMTNTSVNFEVRLYENSPSGPFDIIYGAGVTGHFAGVQRDENCYTGYCTGVTPGLRLVFGGPPVLTPTPGTPTGTSTLTPTFTSSPVLATTTSQVNCYIQVVSATTTCSAPSTFDFSFQLYHNCGTIPSGTAYFEVSPGQQGPWTIHDQQPVAGTYPYVQGIFTETNIPLQYSWYRVRIEAPAPIPHPSYYAQTDPVAICGGYVATSTPTATATHTATATPIACSIEFADVPPGSTFYPYIHCLACLGIINGYPCGGAGEPCNSNSDPYFRTYSNITRGQIAAIVSNAAGFHDPIPLYQQTFEDAPYPGNVNIERLVLHGVIAGYTCGGHGEPCVPPNNRPYFRPNNNATRAQISKVIAIASGLTDPLPPQVFEDVPPSNAFYQYIQQLAGHTFMGGYACGGPGAPCVPPGNRPYFRPNRNASRGQASKIISNTFLPGCSTGR